MMQVSLTLGNEKCSNIEAAGTAIADAGSNRQIIAAVPFTMSVDLPDTDEMTSGLLELADGIQELNDGVGELDDGTQEMADGTADMPDEMDKEIDKMMSEYTYDFDLVSFASKENKSVNAVQFTLSTPKISIEEEEIKEEEEEKKGFLERLKALF